MSALSPAARKGSPRVSLSSLIARAAEQLKQQGQQSQTNTSPEITKVEGLLFSGNPQEVVPRRLLLDKRLTPLERNTWQVFRMLIRDDGVTAFPTYVQLQQFLSAQPFKLASRESIAKALTTLRLTGWLSLSYRARNEATGLNQGNVYLLHDEPVSCFEAIQLDHTYLELLGNGLTHANKSIRTVAENTLQEIVDDPYLQSAVLPSRIQVFADRLRAQKWAQEWDHDAASVAARNTDQKEGVQASATPSDSREEGCETTEFGFRTPVDNCPNSLGSESEPRLSSDVDKVLQAPESNWVRNPNAYSTVPNTSVIKKTVPVLRTRATLVLPSLLVSLPLDQQAKAMTALQPLDSDLQQAVLNEWAVRCSDNTTVVRKPLGYLLGLIQKALQGEFVLWAAQASAAAKPPVEQAMPPKRQDVRPPETISAPSSNRPRKSTEPEPRNLEAGKQGLAAIKSLLRPWLTKSQAENPMVPE